MFICDSNACTGCMACMSVCVRKAISVRSDASGFMHPMIDESKCVNCGKCKTVCPVIKQNKNPIGRVYAAWQKNDAERLAATSGGVFTTLASHFLKRGGVVYGAAFDRANILRHIRVENEDDLVKLRGSKYVQSDTVGIYDSVGNDLSKGYKVLFSGTPCQISALKSFVKEHDNLYCVDIVCHGVPSPKVFKDYLENISDQYKANATDINFRYKEPGWSVFSMKIIFDNGAKYTASKFKDPYLAFFTRGDLTLRQSCFQCKFTSEERCGDITLADFWCIRATNKKYKGIEKGVNLVSINSTKGEELFNQIKGQLFVENKTWEEAHSSNRSFSLPWEKPDKYEEFWSDYSNISFDRIVNKYHYYDEVAEKRHIDEALGRASVYKTPYLIRLGKRIIRKLNQIMRN